MTFDHWSAVVTKAVGRPAAFALASAFVLGWAIGGMFEGYGPNYQMIINTGTTIVTFLMVFLIQGAQNREGMAVQVKLDELVRAVAGARNEVAGIDLQSEAQIESIREDAMPMISDVQFPTPLKNKPPTLPRKPRPAPTKKKLTTP